MCSAMNWVCRPAGAGAHMYEPSPVQPRACTTPRMYNPSLVRALACTRRHMAKPFAADLVRWLRLLANGRALLGRCDAGDGFGWLRLLPNGRARLARRLAAQARCWPLEWAWIRWNAPGCARTGLDAPAQVCTPHSVRYIYSSCSRIILKGCRPITILKTAPNSQF